MRYFPLVDFQYTVLSVLIGIIVLILLCLAFGSHMLTRRRRRDEEELEDYPDGIQASKNPVPPLLIFVYVAFLVWAVSYVIVIGIRGGAF